MALKNVTLIDENTITHKGKRYDKASDDTKAKKGDIIKRKCRHGDLYTENSFYKIKYIDPEGDYIVKDDQGDLIGFIKNRGELFSRVKEKNSEEARKVKPELKAGNFIIIDTRKFSTDITPGKAYEVFENSGGLYFIDDAGDVRCYALSCGDYTIVDAEEAKWESIGRKPGELKVGDIAEVIENVYGNDLGTIVKITHVADSDSDYRVIAGGGMYYYKARRLKLVAPVESRFN